MSSSSWKVESNSHNIYYLKGWWFVMHEKIIDTFICCPSLPLSLNHTHRTTLMNVSSILSSVPTRNVRVTCEYCNTETSIKVLKAEPVDSNLTC